MHDLVLTEIDDRGVATVTLNRPKALNAFDAAQIAAFNAAMARLAEARRLRTVVVAGNGPVFCAGADLLYLQWAGKLSVEENLADARAYAAMAEAIHAMPVPVVARVQGGAYGGGVALAAACDVVIAAESARLAITESRYGFTPSLMVPYLIGRIGQRGCRRWCLTGETMTAAEALRIGLVDRVVGDGDLDPAVAALVDSILLASPGGLAESKASISANGRPCIDDASRERSLAAFVAGRASPQAVEGSAAFIEKRAPRWAKEADA